MTAVTCSHCNKTDFAPGEACRSCGQPFDNATLALIESAQARQQGATPLGPRMPGRVVLVTTPNVPARQSEKALGIVSAEVVVGANVFRDIFAAVTDFVGGRSASYQKVLRSAKQQAQAELQQAAHSLGADAVVGIALDYNEISGDGKSMLFLVMSGTAVKLREPA